VRSGATLDVSTGISNSARALEIAVTLPKQASEIFDRASRHAINPRTWALATHTEFGMSGRVLSTVHRPENPQEEACQASP
jgi:hypothetical protein